MALQIFTFGNIFSVTVKSTSWWCAFPPQLVAYSFCQICSANHWTMMKGVFVGKFYPWSNIIHRLHGGHISVQFPSNQMILCPFKSPSARFTMSSWAGSKPSGSEGNFGSWRYSHVTVGLPKVGWSGCLEYVKTTRRAGGVGREGKREVIMHKLLALSCIIFSVLTACISTHRACAFSLNNSPWNARLANVAMNVCVRVHVPVFTMCHEAVCQVLWVCLGPSPAATPTSPARKNWWVTPGRFDIQKLQTGFLRSLGKSPGVRNRRSRNDNAGTPQQRCQNKTGSTWPGPTGPWLRTGGCPGPWGWSLGGSSQGKFLHRPH